MPNGLPGLLWTRRGMVEASCKEAKRSLNTRHGVSSSVIPRGSPGNFSTEVHGAGFLVTEKVPTSTLHTLTVLKDLVSPLRCARGVVMIFLIPHEQKKENNLCFKENCEATDR
uniref:Uncharacterized protein n=1 Tax=Coccidioides posadasii RMSCC 3488 TaxID=454284 RepID=A0A0J6I5F9_COCPO|nr:hypothetical protein CPAG_02935 [Coccidioides posadasii RMSCC 3488]